MMKDFDDDVDIRIFKACYFFEHIIYDDDIVLLFLSFRHVIYMNISNR